MLVGLAPAKKLKSLYLDDNEFGSDGCKVIAKGLKGLVSLETLSCTSSEITAVGAFTLTKVG